MFGKMKNLTRSGLLFLADKLNTQQELASRDNQNSHFAGISYLPDPDPVLRAKGMDISMYRELLIDPHLSAVLEKRKAGVSSMLWEVKSNGNQAEIDFLTDYFNEIGVYELIEQILNCSYYGYQPFVMFWELINGKRIPLIEDRPQEYFFYDQQNRLRIKQRNNSEGVIADELAFIVARYKPSYLNPYGERIAAKVFWPIAFKKGGIKFWLTMTEKYGMPFLVGKQPKGTKKEDSDKLADMLENMVQDAIAVINDDEKVEIIESPYKDASVNLYKELVKFCNEEISKAVLTVVNTVELGAVGSFAATKTQREDQQDVNLSDTRIVERFFNKVLKYIHAFNFGSGPAPGFVLYDEENVDKVLAERDEILTRVGVRFKKNYIQKNYNIEEDDFDLLEENDSNEFTDFASKPVKTKSKSNSRENIETMLNSLPATLLQKQMEQTLKPVMDLIKNANDYSEIKNKLYELYPDMETSQMESLLEKAIFISELWGRANAG